MKRIFAVILAAGSSRRLGVNKLLVKIDGQSVIQRSVAPFIAKEIEKVVVVTGSGDERLAEELRGLAPVEIVPNPHRLEGMSSSVKAALPFIGGADGVFFHLGDKPFVRREQVGAMLDRFLRDAPHLLIPRFQGQKGHPVLMSAARYLPEMGLLEGDKGLREIIEKHPEDVVFMDGDEGNTFDIDTVQDIEILKRRKHHVEES